MRNSIFGGAAVLSLAIMVTGCGQQNANGPEVVTDRGPAATAEAAGPKVFHENWPEKVPSKGLAKGMALPLETFMTSYADEIAVQQARDIAETSCMRRYGFTNWRTEDLGVSPPVADNASNMPRRYGLSILAEAEQYGYHTPNQAVESTPPPEQEVPEAATVLQGKEGTELVKSFKGDALPEGGCTGEVNREVGDLDTGLVEQLSAESFEKSQATPAVKAAMGAWSSCMKGRGFEAATVWDTDELVGVQGPTATDKEIGIATADVECKEETNLIKVWFDQESVIQRELIKGNQASLSGARTLSDKTLGAAARLSATAGS
ncbi:hypothetical protein ACGFZA_07230 [Streptomyces sp. NPDC048211]|uniref:hypothetical protein n=1 Tax=Streptomyces sp. NPDC048211 TaxID=3365516 RepID=UPI0037215439